MVMTLEYYNSLEENKLTLLQTIKTKLSSTISVNELAWAIKTIEILEDYEYIQEYSDILALIPIRALELSSQQLSSQELMLVSRAIKLGSLPYGKEDRWFLLNYDTSNIDVNGNVIIGERTLESFNDKILEDFYK